MSKIISTEFYLPLGLIILLDLTGLGNNRYPNIIFNISKTNTIEHPMKYFDKIID